MASETRQDGKPSSSSRVLAGAARSVSYNMILQIMFRVTTFVLNALMLRYISKDMLGVVAVRLQLLYSTTLFIAGEAFRRACLSQGQCKEWALTINLLWCSFPLGILCGVLLSYAWMALLEQPDPETVANYPFGVWVYAISAVLELSAQPLLVLGQAMLFVKLKVVVEGLAIGGRSMLVAVLVIFFPQWGIYAFCISQLGYTVIYVSLYYTYFVYYILKKGRRDEDFPMKSVRDLFPKLHLKQWISPEQAHLTLSFFKQGFLKQILTEGERYVMTVFDILSFGDQGIYDVINNLGSLAARFIFLPIEDGSYLFFTQTLERGVPLEKQSKESITLASDLLQCLLKSVVLIGSTILVFGQAYSYLLLDIYGGSLLSTGSGPTLLRWFCVYVLLIAVNGTTEAFVFAAMSKNDVDKYNNKMLLFSIIFLSSSWFLTKTFGSVGFILANCLNMTARITHSIYFTVNYYRGTTFQPLQGLLPSTPVLCTYLASSFITYISENNLCCDQGLIYRLAHIIIGGVCLLVVLATILLTERELINFVLNQWKGRKGTGKEKKES
ncbi:protein RFT1 homolog [Acanthaster planci]|uniref:Protein RFT1 homolog n=1 Tax=Acanthaster planci TaxID=133434 RepID=A0A8B7ZIX4_ACAPL|nr:protein RFT1 homolog [Acanthaster planci]XP_022104958.1 protein RFT1 homolog [Acanthaster planci]XP_022104959.1 protein RFT1 homolog [Acanthaster planci]XP_022104960.1 protein RFT1 homolog [Acanthaster planci]XP_022104961.1 protein RFT1 homolog [Acanthaster planci]XP_022104962.1 protein RFT1 homolog [Acanthaster planci]XP_022104963.1 protein RFT1 homolog [Acanthaster planci]